MIAPVYARPVTDEGRRRSSSAHGACTGPLGRKVKHVAMRARIVACRFHDPATLRPAIS
jgi:hypothetical protein